MIERTQIYVDTSYLLASFYNSWDSGARAQLEIDLPEVVAVLGLMVQEQLRQPVHRQFWYDGIPESGPHRYQRSLRSEPGVQLRTGQLIEWGERRTQKAVDTRLVADMVIAAMKGQVSDIVLVSGDADMLPGVEEAVNAGIRVHLFGFGWDSMSSALRFACDTTTILDPREDFRDSMRIQVLEAPLLSDSPSAPASDAAASASDDATAAPSDAPADASESAAPTMPPAEGEAAPADIAARNEVFTNSGSPGCDQPGTEPKTAPIPPEVHIVSAKPISDGGEPEAATPCVLVSPTDRRDATAAGKDAESAEAAKAAPSSDTAGDETAASSTEKAEATTAAPEASTSTDAPEASASEPAQTESAEKAAADCDSADQEEQSDSSANCKPTTAEQATPSSRPVGNRVPGPTPTPGGPRSRVALSTGPTSETRQSLAATGQRAANPTGAGLSSSVGQSGDAATHRGSVEAERVGHAGRNAHSSGRAASPATNGNSGVSGGAASRPKPTPGRRPNPGMMARHRKLRSRYVPLPNEVWTSGNDQSPFDVGQHYAIWWYENVASEDEKDNAHLLSGGGLPPNIDRPLLQFACESLHEYTLSEYQRVGLRDGFHAGIRGIMLS